MLTHKQRVALGSITPKDCIGWDCEGKKIKPGNKVKVMEEEEERCGKPDYNYCSKGKQGEALSRYMGWIIMVEFKTKKGSETLGCTDINLKKL